LALARHQAIAKQNFVDSIAFDACALNSSFDGSTTQVMRRKTRKITLKCTHGCACSGNDND
jgi:hypothetical protein